MGANKRFLRAGTDNEYIDGISPISGDILEF